MRNLFILGLMITLFASCEKDDSNSISDFPENKNYFPLNVGNYWVYQHYYIDSLGNETIENRTDSVIISRDTIINNNQYFILEGTNYPILNGEWHIIDILRDSSGYLINNKSMIKFSVDNFTDILASKVEVVNNDTLYTLTYQMEKTAAPVTVPAGKFEVLNFKGTITTPMHIQGVKNPRYINNLYSQNVGKVLESSLYIFSSIISEKRMVRYNIEKE